MLIITFAINTVYTNRMLNLVHEKNQNVLSQISKNYDFIDSFSESFLVNVFNDKIVQTLLSQKQPDPFVEKKNIEALVGYINNSPFVHSYYLYNDVGEYYYVVGSSTVYRDFEGMYDTEINDIIKNSASSQRYSYLIRSIPRGPFQTDKIDNVYTYILYTREPKTDELINAFVLNIDSNWIFDSIEAMKTEQFERDSVLMMIDEQGLVLGHSEEELFGENISNITYVEQVLKSNQETGSFLSEEDESVLINYATSPENGVIFITVSVSALAERNLEILRTFLVFFVISLVLVGILISYILSRYIYEPIKRLKSNLYLLFGKGYYTIKGDQNELQEMNMLFNSLRHEVDDLEGFKDANYDVARQSKLRALVTESDINSEMISVLNNRYDVKVNLDERLALIYLNRIMSGAIKKTENINGRTDLECAERTTFDILGDSLRFEVVRFNYDFLIIFNVEKAITYDTMQTMIQNFSQRFNVECSGTLGSEFTFALSPIITDQSKISETYSIVKELCLYRLIYGSKKVITQEMVDAHVTNEFHLPVNECSDLLECIRKSDLSEANLVIEDLMNQMQYYDLKDIRLGLMYISLSLIDLVNNITMHGRVSFEIDIAKFGNTINNTETLEEIKGIFIETCGSIVESIEHATNDKSNSHLDFVYKYIEKNYSDNTLSANSIADEMGITTKYLNVIFKKSTGVSLSNYINNYRLEKASDLLINTKKSIDRIISEVGWGSEKYFYTLFKKKYNVTPSSYRNS